MTIQLTQAILAQEPFASDMAASMGRTAMPELVHLAQHSDVSVRMDVLRVLGKIDINLSYDLIFRGLDDININVVQASLAIIENHKLRLSTQILVGLLDKLNHPATKVRVILMLGEVLKPTDVSILEHYCTVEYGESIALHAVVAMAKIGVDYRQQQFAAYLLSIKNNSQLFLLLFSFIDYIHQTWLLPSLRQLLHNKTSIKTLSANFPDTPKTIRVCDKALLCIASIINQELTFKTDVFANYTETQLSEASQVASQFKY